MLGAVVIGAPLAVVVLSLWLFYLWRSNGAMPFKIHLLMLGPALFPFLILLAGDVTSQTRRSTFDQAHPPVKEVHINMSGRDFVLENSGYSSNSSGDPVAKADKEELFNEQVLWPDKESVANGSFPYDGVRLKSTVDRYVYGENVYQQPPSPVPAPVPLRRSAYPDIKSLVPKVWSSEGSAIVHQYFHYPDHVDVVPALAVSGRFRDDDLRRSDLQGMVLFRIYNYQQQAIMRIEVNGQSLDIGTRAITAVPVFPMPCNESPRSTGGAFIDLDKPVVVRWQTTASSSIWYTSTVTVPPFVSPLKDKEKKAPEQVLLTILPDDTAVAERYLEIHDRHGNTSVKATGLPESAVRYAACGGVYAMYDPTTVVFLGN